MVQEGLQEPLSNELGRLYDYSPDGRWGMDHKKKCILVSHFSIQILYS